MHFEELAVNAALQRGSDESGSGSSSGSGVSDTGSCTICGTTTNLPEHHHVECGADAGLATSAGAGGIDKCAADVAPAAVDTTAAEAEVRSVMDPPTDVITSPSGSVVVVTVPPPAPPIISTTAVTSSSDPSLVVTPSKVRRSSSWRRTWRCRRRWSDSRSRYAYGPPSNQRAHFAVHLLRMFCPCAV